MLWLMRPSSPLSFKTDIHFTLFFLFNRIIFQKQPQKYYFFCKRPNIFTFIAYFPPKNQKKISNYTFPNPLTSYTTSIGTKEPNILSNMFNIYHFSKKGARLLAHVQFFLYLCSVKANIDYDKSNIS